MENFSQVNGEGYNKNEVNEFVDYVIKKTEENISTIRKQQDEIDYLRRELDKSKHESSTSIEFFDRKMSLAEKEANLILNTAKDDASRIVNEALLKADRINVQKEAFNKSIHLYKKKIKMTLMQQLDELDDIEIL